MRAFGYALVEDERPGRFDPEAAKRLGVARRPGLRGAAARRGGRGRERPVAPEQVMGPSRARPHGRDHRRHRALPATVAAAPTPTCWSTTPPSPRRRPSAPPRPATRPRPGRRGRPRGPREAARPGPHLLPLPRRQGAARRPRRSSSRPSPRATSTRSRSRSPSAATPSSSRTERQWTASGVRGRPRPNAPRSSRGRGHTGPASPLLHCSRPLTRSREARKEATK